MSTLTTTNIVIAALGGEGGGVLTEWITDIASQQGYLAQSTSVPGVAQRTGATIYYLELFPRSQNRDDMPVMSLFPNPGDVDIVIASEIIEAGRMVQRGFVTPDRTTLISSDHRAYAISEKMVPGNGIVDASAVVAIARQRAKRFIHDDMKTLAEAHNTVISATLLGALAASGALPFAKQCYEDAIKHTDKAVVANLAAFSTSFNRVHKGVSDNKNIAAHMTVRHWHPADSTEQVTTLPEPTTKNGAKLLDRISKDFKTCAHHYLYLGVKRLSIYQDHDYANSYLDQLLDINGDSNDDDGQLLCESARQLALWMSYEDIIRVAQIKISPERFAQCAKEIQLEAGQYYRMVEFLRPQVEELVSVLPVTVAKKILASPFWLKLLNRFTTGKFVATNTLSGFLLFYLIAKLKPLRPKTWGFHHEHQHIERWLAAVKAVASHDHALAVELAKCARLIKGYSHTRQRGKRNLAQLIDAIEHGQIHSAEQLRQLRNTALTDTSGHQLQQELSMILQ